MAFRGNTKFSEEDVKKKLKKLKNVRKKVHTECNEATEDRYNQYLSHLKGLVSEQLREMQKIENEATRKRGVFAEKSL